MTSFPLFPLEDTEQRLVRRVGRVVGYVPVGLVDLLHVLTHPDVIHLTITYLDSRLEETEVS